jgi:hypothetical protein
LEDKYSPEDDAELQTVLGYFAEKDPDRRRIRNCVRRAVDLVLSLYDEQSVADLTSTEKTTIGTAVESQIRKEFGFPKRPRKVPDFKILDIDVDGKYSIHPHAWMIPPEARGKLCLGSFSDDKTRTFSVGLFRAVPEALRPGKNRDAKYSMSAQGRKIIQWLIRDEPLDDTQE